MLLSELLFGDRNFNTLSESDIESVALLLPTIKLVDYHGELPLIEALVLTDLCSSRSEAKQLINSNAISVNKQKIIDQNFKINTTAILKRGKNKFALVK